MLLPRLSCLLPLLFPLAGAARIPAPQASTLITALSADPDYELLLRLIQRAKLVPTLNRLNGSTIFAPTNDAIERERKKGKKKSLWAAALDDQAEDLADNVQENLRQHLFYHLLNYTLDAVPDTLSIQHTLHFPSPPADPPSKDPPPSPPWLPVPGGLLGGEPQRLRTAVRDGAVFVGVDFQGKGGAKSVKEVVPTGNGNVYGIDRVLDLPLNLLEEVKRHPALSTISRLLPSSLRDSLQTTPHLTLFFPTNAAWDALDEIEMRYLESGFAQDDMAKIVSLHASGDGSDGRGRVGWSENWSADGTTNFTTIEGHTVRVKVAEDGSATVSDRPIRDQDIYAANGVLHTVDSLLLNPDIFQLNAEKYLLALNATSFVSLLRTANMSHYVDDRHDGLPWTILAPRDDLFTMPWATSFDEEDPTPKVNITELRRVLEYHIIPGKLQPKDLENGALIGTELKEDGLGGERQMLEVSVHGPSKIASSGAEVGFGGSLVLGNPVEIGDSIIYVLSKALTPPADVVETALSSAHLSTFLTSAFATHLDDALRTTPSTTVLIPHNNAWSPLGLLTDYLLLPESRDLLKNVISHHVLKEVIYPGDGILQPAGFKTYATLEGSDIRIEGGKVTASGGWSSSAVASPIHVNPHGTLTRTGVIHEVHGGLLIPRSVQVNIGDLATAGKGSIMIGLVQKAGYGGVLNGTMRLNLDEWEEGLVPAKGPTKPERPKQEEVGWALLCPRDDAFKGLNLTRLLEDTEGLKAFVRQHIIPVPSSVSARSWGYLSSWARTKLVDDGEDVEGTSRPIPVADEATYSTLLSSNAVHGDIVFRLTGSNVNSFIVGIKGVQGKSSITQYARVLKWGRTTITSGSTPHTDKPPLIPEQEQVSFDAIDAFKNNRPTNLRSGVILIDRPLVPYEEGWWAMWGQAILLAVVGAVVIKGSTYFFVKWWQGKEPEATYEPIGGSDDD